MDEGSGFGLLLYTRTQVGEGDLPYFIAHAVGSPTGPVGVLKQVFFTKGGLADTAFGLLGSRAETADSGKATQATGERAVGDRFFPRWGAEVVSDGGC